MLKYVILLISLSVSTKGSDVIGTFGRSVTIDCNLPFSENLVWDSTDGNVIAIKGVPVVNNSTKYAIERQNGIRESLVIHALTLADDKVYRCYDLRRIDVKEMSTATVLVRPYFMNMTSPTGPVNEGSEVTLVCQADGGKPLPDIRWYMIDATNNTKELIGNIYDVMNSNGTGRRINTLAFNVTRDHYNATFVCNVTVSVFFEETFAAELDIQLLPLPPVILGFDGIYDENETVHVACTSSGSKPTATVMWFWNGIPVGDFEVVVIPEDDGTSVVTSYFRRRLSRAMNGTILTCAVTNSVMINLNLDSALTNVTLSISYRPNISVESNDVITATSGDFVIMRFHVDARPMPYTVSLLQNGVEVERSLYKIVHRNDSKSYDVTFQRVSRLFEGNYSFSATNRLGTNMSTDVQLKILYVPQCAVSAIQKQAIHVNNSIHLLCRMLASPMGVTMTWRYRHTRNVISTVTATKDNVTNNEQVFGEIEFDPISLLQYTDTYVECYGTNSVGVSTEPCVFQLVHPGPPLAPSNCTINQQAYFVCQPSFDGGSPQIFSLQRLFGTDYLTVFNQSTSEFNLWTFGMAGNVTIRMCSVNREYPDQFSCTPSFEAGVDGIMTSPTRAEEVNTAAFIAGGLVAFIGLLCIASIVIFVLRKKQKVCFKNSKRTRFPYSSNNSAPFKARHSTLTVPDFITSIKPNQSPCTHEIKATGNDIDFVGDERLKKTLRISSRRNKTDKKGKTVQFSSKDAEQTSTEDTEDVITKDSHNSSEENQQCFTLNIIKDSFLNYTRKTDEIETTFSDKDKACHSNQNEVDLERKDHETQQVNVISSTPCSTKQNKINAITEDAVEILKKFESWKPQGASGSETAVCIDATYMYVNGVAVSPIVKYHRGENESNNVETFEIEDILGSNIIRNEKTYDVIVGVEAGKDNYSKADLEDKLDRETIGKSYSNADIADVLDSKTTAEIATNQTLEETIEISSIQALEETTEISTDQTVDEPTKMFIDQALEETIEISTDQTLEEISKDTITLLSDPEMPVNSALSLNLEYSSTDIVSVLDESEKTDTTKSCPENTDKETPQNITTLLSEPELSVNGTLTLNLDCESAADKNSVIDKIETEEVSERYKENTEVDTRSIEDQTFGYIVGETTISTFSECDTALGRPEAFSVTCMNYLPKVKSYMAHSISSPDLTRSDVFLSDITSNSCGSLHNISEDKLTIRRLSESDIELDSATSLVINRKVSNTSLEIECDDTSEDIVPAFKGESAKERLSESEVGRESATSLDIERNVRLQTKVSNNSQKLVRDDSLDDGDVEFMNVSLERGLSESDTEKECVASLGGFRMNTIKKDLLSHTSQELVCTDRLDGGDAWYTNQCLATRLSESDIELQCTSSLDGYRMNVSQKDTLSHNSQELICSDGLDDHDLEYKNDCVIDIAGEKEIDIHGQKDIGSAETIIW